MANTKISEYSSTPASNTDIDGINIAEGCAPSGINNAIRELMSQLKDFQAGTAGDSFNGPIGTTTAVAGAFTTLAASGAVTLASTLAVTGALSGSTATFSGNVTLSGGTANGVLHLNGSKVLTSSNALTFDGGVLSISGSAAQNLIVNSTGSSSYMQFANSGGITGYIGSSGGINTGGGNNALGLRSQNEMVFATGGSTERMRLSASGNLGIGTSSPTQKLTVSGAANFSRFSINSNPIDVVSTAQSFARFQSTGADFYLGTESSTGGGFFPSSTAYAAILYNANATPMQFYTSGALRVTIDSSGNLIQTVNTTAATLTTNQTLTFSIVNNSLLRISVRGSDGTTRTADITLA